MRDYAIFLEVSPWFVEAFEAAAELGLSVINISRTKVAGALWVPEFNETEIKIALHSNGITNGNVAFFWSVKDYLVPLCGILNNGTNDRYFSDRSIGLTKNKIAMRRACASIDCNPEWQVLELSGLTEEITLPYPLVVKPANGYASLGVQRVNSSKEMSAALTNTKSTFAIINQAIGVQTSNQILVEEFVEGREISVDVMVAQGSVHVLGICSKSEMKAPFFEEISYVMPGDLSASEMQRIKLTTGDVIKAIGVTNGPIHLEFIISSKQVILLDIGLRIGGGGLTHYLVNYSTGINFVKCVFQNLLSRDEAMELEVEAENLAVLYLHQVGEGGVVSSVAHDLEKVLDLKEFRKVQFFVNEGETLRGYPQHSGLPGFTLFEIPGVNHSSRSRSETLLEACQTHLKIVYEQTR